MKGILLVGQETKYRKHIDWEIYSSMYDGAVSRKSGILVVQLPGAHNNACFCSHANEKSYVYPDCGGLHSIETKSGFEGKYPFLPDRIIDNLYAGGSNISVTTWERISNDSANLRFLVDVTASARATAIYDLSRDMRRNNGSPQPSPTFRLI